MGRARGRAPQAHPRPVAVAPVRPTELQSAYDHYRAAAGSVSPDLIVTPDMSAARVALIRMLIADGWDAPAIVLERLHSDEEALQPRLLVAS